LKNRAKEIAKYVVKLGLSILALWFVGTKVNWTELISTWRSAEVGWIILAFSMFIFSKLASSFRLNAFFRANEIELPHWTNIKLYWLGMYYNLFLPGGVGGDGYKVYLLKKSHGKSIKSLTWIMILDRLGGLAAIGIIVAFLTLIIDLPEPVWNYAAVGTILIIPIGAFLGLKWFFKQYVSIYSQIIGWSIGVQGAQVLSALCLLVALNQQDDLLAYLMLFLISSVAAMLPISLGGLGARELAMFYMADYLSLNPDLAMSISLAFYAISAITSLAGVYFSLNTKSIGLQQQE
jgi:uncharacterized membrane protein YbhN (UPF0104 family)